MVIISTEKNFLVSFDYLVKRDYPPDSGIEFDSLKVFEPEVTGSLRKGPGFLLPLEVLLHENSVCHLRRANLTPVMLQKEHFILHEGLFLG